MPLTRLKCIAFNHLKGRCFTQRRGVAGVPALRNKYQVEEFSQKKTPKHVKFALIGALTMGMAVAAANRRNVEEMIAERNKLITDYVYIDLAKGDRYVGRLLIGVFADVVPMTVNNFLSLIEGHKVGQKTIGYKNTNVHAIIPNKHVIIGDVVTGEGSDSLSIYGPRFPDENFSLPFLERGDVAMFNRKPNSNGSQFLITLRPLTEHNGRYVVFGKLVGGHELLRLLVSDVNLASNNTDYARANQTTRILDCGIYNDPSQGPPQFLSDRDQGIERKLAYAAGHQWQPLSAVWQSGEIARKIAVIDMKTGGEFQEELKRELKDKLAPIIDDRRRVLFINASKEERKALHASMYKEQRGVDIAHLRKLNFQRKQKMTEQEV